MGTTPVTTTQQVHNLCSGFEFGFDCSLTPGTCLGKRRSDLIRRHVGHLPIYQDQKRAV